MEGLKNVNDNILRAFFRQTFISINCLPHLSEPVVNGLIETSLRGVDSHGIRLLPHYIKAALSGRINLDPRLAFKDLSITMASLDADHTFGITAATLAMNKAISMASQFGIGCTTVFNSTHFGAAAIFALMAARQDMLGLSFTNTDALVLPYGGKKPFLGTNPFCFAAPCEGEDPFCLDMSTSVITWNKLQLFRAIHKQLEPGWAADQVGKMCTDPHVAQALLPIGSYKGYNLGLVVEVLCSLLTNMPYGPHISRMFPLNGEKRQLGHFLMAIDVSKFQEISLFKQRMKQLLDELRSMAPAEGFDGVRVANDPEKEACLQRSVRGIPVSQEELKNFRELAQSLEIDVRDYPALFGEMK